MMGKLKRLLELPGYWIRTHELAFETRGLLYEMRESEKALLRRMEYDNGELRHRLAQQDMFIEDILRLHLEKPDIAKPFHLKTDFPVAYASHDHIHPLGTMQDSTRSPRFVGACETLFKGHPLHVLDLGCAGGGLVYDFLMRGHRAMGLEGSDLSLLERRSVWSLFPHHLKTCDITKPYRIVDDGGEAAQFHVISAWEVMEHIPEEMIDGMLSNIKNHLRDDGVFVASIATFECADPETGAIWHVTIKPREWWVECFARNGLEVVDPAPFAFRDYVRGSGNGHHDWSAMERPDMGFHLVLRKAKS